MAGVDAGTVLTLRRAGWTAEQIVTEAGATPGTVARGLGARGSGPDSWTLPTLVKAVGGQTNAALVNLLLALALPPKRGYSTRVSSLTLPFWPFSPPARPYRGMGRSQARRRQPSADLAREHSVSAHRVSTAAKPFGPFPYPSRDLGQQLGAPAIARLFGVATPTVKRWQSRSDFPARLPPSAGTGEA